MTTEQKDDYETVTPRTRRSLLLGGGLLLTGGVTGFSLSSLGRSTTADPDEYPYWTENWTVRSLEMTPRHDDIRFVVELRNDSDHRRTWPGVFWAGGRDHQDWIERTMPVEVAGGEERGFAPWADAEAGVYDGGIVGVDEWDTEVTVRGV